jgi:hypothetical protein
MLDFFVGQIQYTPSYLHHGNVSGLKALLEMPEGFIGVDLVSTGEDIQSAVAEFRPGVHRKVGLCNDDYAADAVRRKLVKEWMDDGGPGQFHRLQEVLFQGLRIVQGGSVTFKKLDDQMSSQ